MPEASAKVERNFGFERQWKIATRAPAILVPPQAEATCLMNSVRFASRAPRNGKDFEVTANQMTCARALRCR